MSQDRIKLMVTAIMLLVSITLLTGCSAFPEKSDAITSATQKDETKVTAPKWQVVDTEGLKQLFKDNEKKGAFIWYNGSELLVVGDLKDTTLPPIDSRFNLISKEALGYSFVSASAEVFTGLTPDLLIVAVPKNSESSLDQIKLTLKETLAGKAMQTLALDQFYIWLYE